MMYFVLAKGLDHYLTMVKVDQGESQVGYTESINLAQVFEARLWVDGHGNVMLLTDPHVPIEAISDGVTPVAVAVSRTVKRVE